MSINSQARPSLGSAAQTVTNQPVAALVSQQIGKGLYTADFTMPVDPDRFPVNSAGGAIVATVPLATSLVKGKPYIFEKVHADNSVTVTFSGDDVFEGSGTYVLTAEGDMFAFIVDLNGVIRRAFPAARAGDVPTGALAIAQNLADVNDVVTSRTNLAVNKTYLPLRVATLVGTGVYRILSPYAGRITKIDSIIEGVLTTADATLTAKIGGVAVTSGVITITQVSSAAGDKDTCTPSAANTVAVGDEISLTVGGGNNTATVANCWIEITRT